MSRKRAAVPGVDELFKGRPTAGPQEAAEEQADPPQEVKQSKRQAVKTSSNQNVKQSKRQAVKTSKPEQVTVYLHPETVQRIETARFQLLTEAGLKATKSALVEACVEAVIDDLARLKEQLTEG